jgi:hypothetical protein
MHVDPSHVRAAIAAALVLACGGTARAASAQAAPSAAVPPAQHVAPVSAAIAHRQQHRSQRADARYAAEWGVQDLTVRYTASGSLIRFSYRVVEPALARRLVDKADAPLMLGQRSHALLQVPTMEKVGPLRQTNDVTAGKEYWMAFSNKGNFVRPGDRVNVMIGAFHADGLLVE